MPDPTPKTLTCPTCGAPLNYDGRSTTVRCDFCKNVVVLETLKPDAADKPQPERPVRVSNDILDLVRFGNKLEAIKRYRELFDVSLARAKYAIEQIEAGNPLDPEAGFPARQAEAAVKVAAATAATATAATATGAWLGCAITGFILLLVGGIIGFIMLQPGGPVTPRLVAMDQSITVPAAQDTAPDVVSLFYNVNDETRLLGRVSRADSKLAWMTDPLPGDGFVDAIAGDNERVYAVVESDLLAFNAADGSLAWKTALPDKLDSGEDNLVVKDGLAIVMTMDRSIQAYETGTGNEVWSRPLLSYARGFQIMGKWLVILDYIGDGHDFNVFLLDPADGSEEHVIFPSCKSDSSWEENLNDNSGIVYDNAAKALYLAFGSSFGCIQRYDLGNSQLTWETRSGDSVNTASYGFNYFQTSGTLYFGNQARLFALDKQSGALKLLFEDDSYEMVPLALSGDTLLVLARRTKGSQRFELWGLDSASGERTWQLVPENASPVDPPYEMSGLVDKGESGWTWQLTPAGFLLIEFQAEPNQLVLTTYNPADGSNLGEKIVPMKDVTGDFYSVPVVIGWHASEMYFILDSQVYALDVETGQLVMKYQ
jgi:outer membrane protein assembly factor BamB